MIMPPTQDPAGGRKYKSRWDTFLLRSFYATGPRPAPSGPGWIVRRVSCLWHSPHREPHLTSAVCAKWGAEWPMTSVSHFSICTSDLKQDWLPWSEPVTWSRCWLKTFWIFSSVEFWCKSLFRLRANVHVKINDPEKFPQMPQENSTFQIMHVEVQL